MAKTKRRNHFIPRLLLNRFASRVERKKYWIWQLSSTGKPRESSTRDVGVATWFYGGPESRVEDAFVPMETDFQQMLADIDVSQSPQQHSHGLRQLVWTLAVRTRAFREQFVSTIDQFLCILTASAGSEKMRREFIKMVVSSVDEQCRQALLTLSPPQRAVAQGRYNTPAIREGLLQLAVAQAKSLDLPALFAGFAGMLRDQQILTKSTKNAQVRALATLLEERRLPDWFCPTHWHVLRAPYGSFVLGDACVFAVHNDGISGSLLRSAESWREVYLPISSSQVLIATHNTAPPSLDQEGINRASAAVASSYIYAAQILKEIVGLVRHIGTGEPLVAQKQLSKILADS